MISSYNWIIACLAGLGKQEILEWKDYWKMILENRLALTIAETALAIGNVHPNTVRNLIRRGKLVPTKPGGIDRVLIPVAEIQRLMELGRVRLEPVSMPERKKAQRELGQTKIDLGACITDGTISH